MKALTSTEAHSSVQASSADASESLSTAPTVTTVASLVPLKNTDALAQASLEAPTEAAQAGTTQEQHSKDTGLPQLNRDHWAGQMIWLVVIFAVFYLAVSKLFAPRLRDVIAKRGATIAEDLANARANRDEAEAQAKEAAAEIAEAHAAARRLATESVARSNAEISARMAAKDEELSARLSKEEANIRAKRDAAMSHVVEIASETASALVEKLTGKAATAAALKSAQQKV